MYVVRRSHMGGKTTTKHAALAEALDRVAGWHRDAATTKVTLVKRSA